MEVPTPPRVVVGGVLNDTERDRLVKSNILYIDGRNLHRSRMLDYHPLGRNEERQPKTADGRPVVDDNSSLLSRYVREILVALCQSDSRYYARRFGVPLEDYRKTLEDYFVSPLWPLFLTLGGDASQF